MCIEEFSEKVCSELRKKLGDDYKIEQKVITKNNNTKFHGVLISRKDDTLVPTFYLDDYYKDYREGTVEETAAAIYTVYTNETPKGKICFEWFKEFDTVKDKICYKLINKNANRKLLGTIPYIDFLDLALCFFVVYRNDHIGDGTIMVRNSFLDSWGVTVTDIMKAAEKNTPEYYPAVLKSITDILAEVHEGLPDFPGRVCLDVLTNSEKTNGAAAMLYPDVLKTYSERLGGSFYIIPSSVHEVLLLPEAGTQSASRIREMIAEVNNTQMEQHEILSYNVYYYDAELCKVTVK